MSYRSTGSRRILSAFALLCFCSFLTVAAQSGRRVPKKAPEPTPAPEPAPEMTSVSGRPQRPKPALTLILGMDRSQTFGNFRNIQIVLTTVAERLESNRSVELRQVFDDYERGEAVERAKREPEAYVVLLELRSGNRVSGRNADFSIQYWIFAPGTGKLKASGQTVPEDVRRRGILKPRGPTIYGDYQLQDAAMDVAERILAVFSLKAPSGPLG